MTDGHAKEKVVHVDDDAAMCQWESAVRLRAYDIYERTGRDDAVANWEQARRELLEGTRLEGTRLADSEPISDKIKSSNWTCSMCDQVNCAQNDYCSMCGRPCMSNMFTPALRKSGNEI